MGVSTDSAELVTKFRDSLGAKFPFLPDSDGKVATAYGVYDESGHYAKRVTFVVDPKGMISHVERDLLTTDSALGACPLSKPKKKKATGK